MFSFSTVSTQHSYSQIELLNKSIEALDGLSAQLLKKDKRRERFYHFLNEMNLNDKLLSLGYAALGFQDFLYVDFDITPSMKALNGIANQFSPCSRVMIFSFQEILTLANEVCLILENINKMDSPFFLLLDETKQELMKIKQELQAFQKELIAGMKIYLKKSKNKDETNNKGLIYDFTHQIQKAIRPLRLQSTKYRYQKILKSNDAIENQFIRNKLLEEDIPIEDYEDNALQLSKNTFSSAFIDYIHQHGSPIDQEFLFLNGFKKPSYLSHIQTIIKQEKTMIGQTADFLWHLPEEINDFYHGWQRQRQINALSIREKIKLKYEHLPENHQCNLLEFSMEEYLDKSKAQITAEKETDNQFISIHDFPSAMLQFKAETKIDNNTFSDQNVNALKQVCKFIFNINEGYYFTEEEKRLLPIAADFRKKVALGQKISNDELQKAMEATKFLESNRKYLTQYRSLANQFDSQGIDNIFNIFKNHANNKNDQQKQEAINRIAQTWLRRSKLALISSEGLAKQAWHIEQLVDYREFIKSDFNLEHETYLQFLKNQSTGFTHHQRVAASLVENLDKIISDERGKVIGAMLERLVLIKDQVSLNPNEIYEDDVILATLRELIPFGLESTYVQKIAAQTEPHKTLTLNLIKQFRNYINQWGSDYQKEKLKDFDNFFNSIDQDWQIVPETPVINPKIEFILSHDDEQLINNYGKKYFKDEDLSLFISLVKESMKQNKNLDDACKEARLLTANAIIHHEAEHIFANLDDAKKIRFINLAKKISEKYFNASNIENLFEDSVIGTAFKQIVAVETKAKSLSEEMHAENIDEREIQVRISHFADKACQYLENDSCLDKAIIQSELDLMIFTHVKKLKLSKNDKKIFTERVKTSIIQQANWEQDQLKWLQIIIDEKNFIHYKNELTIFLSQEYDRMKLSLESGSCNLNNWFMDNKKTTEKQTEITEALRALDQTSDYNQLYNISQSFLKNKKLMQKRNIFGYFTSQESTLKTHLMHIVETIKPPKCSS